MAVIIKGFTCLRHQRDQPIVFDAVYVTLGGRNEIMAS